jgi:hypothetical protein
MLATVVDGVRFRFPGPAGVIEVLMPGRHPWGGPGSPVVANRCNSQRARHAGGAPRPSPPLRPPRGQQKNTPALRISPCDDGRAPISSLPMAPAGRGPEFDLHLGSFRAETDEADRVGTTAAHVRPRKLTELTHHGIRHDPGTVPECALAPRCRRTRLRARQAGPPAPPFPPLPSSWPPSPPGWRGADRPVAGMIVAPSRR